MGYKEHLIQFLGKTYIPSSAPTPPPPATGMRASSSGKEERAERRVKRAWGGDLVLSSPEALASRE